MAKKEKLNPRHEKFIQGILEGKTQTQAYIDAGYSAKNARQHAHQLIVTNSYVAGEIQRNLEEAKQEAKRILELDSAESAQTMTELRDSGTKDDFCRLYAAKDILDRTGLKVAEKLEHSGSVDHNVKVEFVGIPDGYFDSRDDRSEDDSS